MDRFTDGYKQKRFETLDSEYFKLPAMEVLIGNFIKHHADLYSGVGKGK